MGEDTSDDDDENIDSKDDVPKELGSEDEDDDSEDWSSTKVMIVHNFT